MTATSFSQTPSSLLGTLQLSDSLFPSGRYTLSHGLEMFVETGLIHDAATLEAVVSDYLLESLACCEAVAVASAHQAASQGDVEKLIRIDRQLHAIRLPVESSAASIRTGQQFIRTARRLVDSEVMGDFAREIDLGRAVGGHAVVLGIATFSWGIDQFTAVLSELYAYTAALIGAALRLMRLDHVEAQAIVLRLHEDMTTAAQVAIDLPFQDMHAFAPMIDVMQMKHERSRMRMFAS